VKEVIFIMKRSELDKYREKLLEMGILKIQGRQFYQCSEKEVKQLLLTLSSEKNKMKVQH
jgi:hypothetical protein